MMDQFIASTHGEHHILRQKRLFDWFFGQAHDDYTLISAFRDEELVGILGYLPTKFLWGDKERPIEGAWMAHWMVIPELRTGLGALLMRRMQELYPIVAGQGANGLNKSIVTKMKFKFLDHIPRYITIFDSAFIGQLETELKIENIDDLLYKEDLSLDFGDVQLVETPLTQVDFSPNWDLYPEFKYGTLRDAQYLNHRYINYPFFTYYVLRCGSPDSPSVCVYRIEETSGLIQMKVGRVLELFYPQSDSGQISAQKVMAKALLHMEQEQCRFADFYCTNKNVSNILNAFNFKLEQRPTIPNLLNPIVPTPRDQNLEIWTNQSIPDVPVEHLYVTKSDGDQDRPNIQLRAKL